MKKIVSEQWTKDFSIKSETFSKGLSFWYQHQYQNHFLQRQQKQSSHMIFSKHTNVTKEMVPFKHDGPCFPNPDVKQNSNIYFVKGKNDMKNLNQWLEGK